MSGDAATYAAPDVRASRMPGLASPDARRGRAASPTAREQGRGREQEDGLPEDERSGLTTRCRTMAAR